MIYFNNNWCDGINDLYNHELNYRLDKKLASYLLFLFEHAIGYCLEAL